MPIEIRELHIKVAVAPAQNAQTQQSTQPAQSSSQQQSTPAQQDELIAGIVEQVLQILQNKTER